MRWRLDTTRLEQQKQTRHVEAEKHRHTVNLESFNTAPLHAVPGHRPGVAFSDMQVNPELQKIHRGTLSESQFDAGRLTGYRPVGSFSPSSYRGEDRLQDGQEMPAGRDGSEYR